jgi:hypothetical protein
MAKILFGAVYLDHEIDRLGGQGFAYANTTHFRARGAASRPGEAQANASKAPNYTLEFDTASGLLTITAESGASVIVPRERVKRFEPLPVTPAAPSGK